MYTRSTRATRMSLSEVSGQNYNFVRAWRPRRGEWQRRGCLQASRIKSWSSKTWDFISALKIEAWKYPRIESAQWRAIWKLRVRGVLNSCPLLIKEWRAFSNRLLKPSSRLTPPKLRSTSQLTWLSNVPARVCPLAVESASDSLWNTRWDKMSGNPLWSLYSKI